jgi:hypothetical protein
MRTLLSYGHGARVDGHVPVPRVAVSRSWCVDSTIRGGGDGGLARRASAAATTIVVLVIVATAMTVIVVLDCCSCSGGHRCRYCRHWAGETAWRTTALLSGAQHLCRVLSGQLNDLYYPCGSPLVAGHPEL